MHIRKHHLLRTGREFFMRSPGSYEKRKPHWSRCWNPYCGRRYNNVFMASNVAGYSYQAQSNYSYADYRTQPKTTYGSRALYSK